jgi:hypothetical protein
MPEPFISPARRYLRVPDNGVMPNGMHIDDVLAEPDAPLVLRIGSHRYLAENAWEQFLDWTEAQALCRRDYGFELADRRPLVVETP